MDEYMERVATWLRHSVSLACASVFLTGCGGLSMDLDARLARAKQAQESEDFLAMIVDLKTILQQSPEHLEARLLLGDALRRTGDFGGAEKEFSRAVGIIEEAGVPDADAATQADVLHQARLGLAMSQIAMQKFADARQTTAAILARQPDDMFTRMLAVQAAYAAGEIEEARGHLEVVYTDSPDDPIVNLFLGMVSMQQGRNQEGEQYLSRALQLSPENGALRLMLARIQLGMARPVAALATFAPIIDQSPDDPRVMQFFEAVDLRDEVVAARALDLADELAAQSASSPTPSLIRARVNFLQRRFDAAVQFYSEAERLGAGRHAVLGGFLSNRGLGNVAEADRLLENWLASNADDVLVRNALASSQLAQGEQGGATEQYERIIEAGGNDPTVLNNLAWLYGEIGDERAVQLAREAHRLAPDMGAITDTLGWLLVQNDELTEGIQMLRQAVAQAPQIVEIRQHLASALSADGQDEEASRVLAELVGAGANLNLGQDTSQ